MQIIEVNDKRTARQFLDVARIIYKGDPNFVCPLDGMIEAIFDPAKNNYFSHGECIRWILKDDNGKLIGRTAAFINRNKAYNYEVPVGGMGLFECINDQKAAFALFEQCKTWLAAKGMEAMDGPINFGENENFWGLLVEGFSPASFGMNYHLPYYKELFESYGFKQYFEQVTNKLDLTIPFPERFWKISERIMARPGYHYAHFQKSNTEKFLQDFKTIYDKAWAFHDNFTPISIEDLREQFRELKSIMDEEMIWFVYHENEPIAFLVMAPDANQILYYLNGHITSIWDKLKFLYYKKTKGFTRTRIIVMGVVPQYRRLGVESGIFWNMGEVMKRKPRYKEVELSWVGDFNPQMMAIHKATGAVFHKRHITYRYMFDPSKTVILMNIIPPVEKNSAQNGNE
ncbi:MAG: GNAT family N-acetyltransferase [Bacteroidota bacterium]|nr:GNAT family N-acetyltransferase [Bacteroidota bacterium]